MNEIFPHKPITQGPNRWKNEKRGSELPMSVRRQTPWSA